MTIAVTKINIWCLFLLNCPQNVDKNVDNSGRKICVFLTFSPLKFIFMERNIFLPERRDFLVFSLHTIGK